MKKFFLFLFLVPAMLVQAQTQITCAEARTYALSVSANDELHNNGEMYVVQGYVTAIQYAWSSTYKNITFWMADTQNGGKIIEAFKCVANTQAEAPNVGALVRVTGQLTKYYSTPEFAAGCTCEIIDNGIPPINLGHKTIAEFIALANTKDTCILTGVVTNIASTQYGNFHINDGTDSAYVYGMSYFSSYGIEEGDTVTIAGIYQLYGTTHEVTGARYISHVHPVVEVPVEMLRVCAQNLENYYYNYDLSSRPDYNDAEGFRVKTQKIVNAMLTIDADIYAFCEVEAKPIVLQQLADSMNRYADVAGRYAAVYDGIDYTWTEGMSDNQLKSGFIYRTDKVATYGSNTGAVSGNGYYAHTMRIQTFKQLVNNEKFIISMNHFKAKLGEDQGEPMRQINANNLVNAVSNLSADPDILILGDLNCEVNEAPIQTILNAGFEEQLLKYNPNAWSHCYDSGELIDHVLANPSMAEQIVDARVVHICAHWCNNAVSSEDSWSDHDPYVVEMYLGKKPETTPIENVVSTEPQAQKILRNGQIVIIRSGVEYTITGQRVY